MKQKEKSSQTETTAMMSPSSSTSPFTNCMTDGSFHFYINFSPTPGPQKSALCTASALRPVEKGSAAHHIWLSLRNLLLGWPSTIPLSVQTGGLLHQSIKVDIS
jgi:hypothetical protein